MAEKDRQLSEKLAIEVMRALKERFGEDDIPTVEDIQDIVERF